MLVDKMDVNQLALQAQQAKIAGDMQTANLAFEQIHAEIDRYLFAAVASLYRKDKDIKSYIDIEDMVAEAYLIAWDNLEKFRMDGDFAAWVRRIAVNQCCMALRKKKRKQEGFQSVSLDNEDYAPQAVNGNVEDEVESRLRSVDIVRIFKSLPEPQYLVFILYYIEGMKTRTIAERLNVSESTITSRLSYARKKIEHALDKEKANGNELFGAMIINGALLRSTMESAGPNMPTDFSAHVTARVMEGISATHTAAGITATGTTGAAAASAAGTSAAGTISAGVGIVGKIAALATGTKAALAAAAAVVVIGGGGAGIHVYHQNQVKQAEAAAVVQQQARLDAEQAAQEAAGKKAKEEENARQAKAVRLAAEHAEAERLAAEQAEAERLAVEQAEAEQLAAEQAEAERLAAKEAAARAEAESQAAVEAQEAEKAAAQSANQSTIEAQQKAAEDQVTAPVETTGQKDVGGDTSGTVGNTGMTMSQLIAARKNAGVPVYRKGGGDLLGRRGSPDNMWGDWSGQQEPTGTPANKYKPVKDGTAKWEVQLGGWLYVQFSEIRLITPSFDEYVIGYVQENAGGATRGLHDDDGLPSFGGSVSGEHITLGHPDRYWKDKNGTVYDPVFKEELTRGTEEFIYGSFVGQDEPTFYCKGKEIADRTNMSWDSSLGGWVDTKYDRGGYDDWISVIYPCGSGANHYPNR